MNENHQERNEDSLEDTPPPLRPKNLLDSIFREGGPMPPAKIWMRAVAYTLDLVLLMAISLFIVWKIAMPQAYPGAFAELIELSQGMNLSEFMEDWLMADTPPTQISENLQQAAAYAFQIQLFIFWIYFSTGEAFFAGSSLGKRLLRIRTISTVTLDKPPILVGIVRGGAKTFLAFFPLGALVSLFVVFLNKRRQLGHDLLSKTAVIDEKFVNLTQKS